MNRRAFRRPLITIGLLSLVGAAGAQAYYTHQLVERVAARDTDTPAMAIAPTAAQGDPWAAMHADMLRMQAQMDQAFNNAFRDFHGMPGMVTQTGANKVTVEEQGKDYVVKANLPGAKESDIDVKLDGRLLSISSQTQGSEKQTGDKGKVTQQESYASTFQQAFTLPGPVNASGMHSKYHDGVLTVTIPKATG
jgi:HSP20 family protein